MNTIMNLIYVSTIFLYCISITFYLPSMHGMSMDTVIDLDPVWDKFDHINDLHYEAFVGSAIVLIVFIIVRILKKTQYYRYIFFILFLSYIIVCIISLIMAIIKLLYLQFAYDEAGEALIEIFGTSIWIYPVSKLILLIFLFVEFFIIIYC